MEIGKFRLTPIEFGRFKLDGGAMFGVIPKVLWERFHPADEQNRIEMALRCLLVEVDNRKILIDTGFGEERAEKFKKIYAFRGVDNYLEHGLSKCGLKPEDITDVFLTHLHFDHDGGATKNKQSNPIPSFPNAIYYIQKRQLKQARSRFERDRASYFPYDFEPLIENNVARIVDGPFELMKGFDTIICNGHTPGMQLPLIRSEHQTLLYGADLIPLASQFSLPWIMSYDLDPVQTLKEKKKILAQASEERWIIFFEHDPECVMSKVELTEKGFRRMTTP